LPYLASYLNKVMVNNNPQDARILYNSVKKTLNNYNVASEDVKYLQSTLGQLSNEDLTQYNLNSEDARLFFLTEGIAELIKSSESERTALREELLK
jgi:hypothetical protein